MIERFDNITTDDGDMAVFVVHPETGSFDGGQFPTVVFQMDAPGMREELRNMCRRLASAGYYVIAPMLYYRWVTEYNLFETGDRDRMFELMNGLSNSMASSDIGACLAYAEADPVADTTRCGTVGYCMSGPFAVVAAADYPEQIKAAASIHGVRLVTDTDDSPHARLPDVAGELYIGCAEVDEWAPPETVEQFDKAMSEAGTKGRVEWYAGTEHGFSFAERPQYVQASSERHWERLHDLFWRRLRQS